MARTLGGHHTASVQKGHVANWLLLIRKGGMSRPNGVGPSGRGTCARDVPGGEGGLGRPHVSWSGAAVWYLPDLPLTPEVLPAPLKNCNKESQDCDC